MFEHRLHLDGRPTHGRSRFVDGARGLDQGPGDTILDLGVLDHSLKGLGQATGHRILVFDCTLQCAAKLAQMVFDALTDGE
jgi:hypothetical protein